MTTRPTVRGLCDEMAVDVPEGSHGTVTVERFTVEANSLENLRLTIREGRGCDPGTYTRLLRNGQLWMSDTTAERLDHYEPAARIRGGRFQAPAERVLIGGLGLGMILRVALLTEGVRHVDVVEIDPDVLALVGPHYEAMAAERGVSLVFHEADVFAIKWKPGTRWDVAWFDVWGGVSTDDLEAMSKLRRSYGRRTDWCDCWGRTRLLRMRQHERANGWW